MERDRARDFIKEFDRSRFEEAVNAEMIRQLGLSESPLPMRTKGIRSDSLHERELCNQRTIQQYKVKLKDHAALDVDMGALYNANKIQKVSPSSSGKASIPKINEQISLNSSPRNLKKQRQKAYAEALKQQMKEREERLRIERQQLEQYERQFLPDERRLQALPNPVVKVERETESSKFGHLIPGNKTLVPPTADSRPAVENERTENHFKAAILNAGKYDSGRAPMCAKRPSCIHALSVRES